MLNVLIVAPLVDFIPKRFSLGLERLELSFQAPGLCLEAGTLCILIVPRVVELAQQGCVFGAKSQEGRLVFDDNVLGGRRG